MKRGIKILAGVVALALIGYGVLAIMNRPISREAVNAKIQKRLNELVEDDPLLSSVLLTIYSNETGYFGQFAAGTKNHDTEEPVHVDVPYHSASIGKTMCAAIFGKLVDEGIVSFDDSIDTWLSQDTLEGLFVIEGVDYSHEVSLRQLLSHTSGIADYFEGPVFRGETMLERIAKNPDETFTPQTLIAFTRDNQQPVGRPGQQFHYSDTGYILLGLILETIEGKPYSDILAEQIFRPLGMDDSYLMLHHGDPSDIIGIYINGIDYSGKKALSVDWAGGGIVTTMKDLLLFMRALEAGDIVSENVYGEMSDFAHKYEKGIYYGLGMMYFDFSELSFLLGSMTDLYGGVGATGTFMFYDEKKDTYYMANFGSLDYAEKGIEELVKIRMIYDRMRVD
ncbi:serine hydrolase [Paenibacillus sp. MY03]|jgi:D-alanyl-D-alanine carboxypeptidase|uniref:serine hydrolase domain-containing protein n=1 Tax=Paenibacillus sp. MY03 TaxID=302980 RepID=UPI000B3CDEF6|nr:serine hydrolase domain-containing protein [Paenibacillus sp. MY03]OUS76154.1 serine hydrolase [Paenibacillus sp. MY03]